MEDNLRLRLVAGTVWVKRMGPTAAYAEGGPRWRMW